MKVSLPKDGVKKREVPPLPLKPEEVTEDNELKLAKFKLRTNPTDPDSPTYSFTIVKLDGSESLRQALKFYQSIGKIIHGLNITNALNKLTIIKELLTGQALQQFNDGYMKRLTAQYDILKEAARQTSIAAGEDVAQQQVAVDAIAPPGPQDDWIFDGLRKVIIYMSPHKALAKQKRWMRRFCRKPLDMTTREYVNHICRINDDELPNLAPFGGNRQKLSADELIDIVLNGVPRNWIRDMDKQDFDPIIKTLAEVVDFCERMEAAEDFEPARNGQKTNGNNNKKDKKDYSKKGKSDSKGGDKYCLLHGNNPTHATDECHVLKKQAQSLRKTAERNGDQKPAFNNKTWKRDASKSTTTSKKELATFVRKQARKELYAFAKKRKMADEDDDETSTASLNNIEAKEDGEIDLSVFNFQDMDDLKIDSEDDGNMSSSNVSV